MSAWDVAWGTMLVSLGFAATGFLLAWTADVLMGIWRRL